MLKIYEYEVELIDIITETPETKTFRLDMAGKDFPFVPGQFVMFACETDNGPVTRPLSIASSPMEKGIMDLTIKKFPEGAMSSWMCDHVKTGDKFRIKGPYGVFTLNESSKQLVFIAGGSGIAPFRSMWRYVVAKKLDLNIVLLFSSKNKDCIIFREELDELNSNGHMRVVHTLTRNQDPAWNGYARRIDKEMIREVVGSFDNKLFYACGPPQLCESAQQALIELGVEPQRIKLEKYD